MDPSTLIAIISVAVSLVAIVVSALVARSQTNVARQQQLLPFISDVLNEFNEPEFKALLNYVRNDLARDLPQPANGLRSLDVATANKLRPLTSYFNEMGVLVANNVVPVQIISGVMGGSIAESWRVLAPYVYARREERGKDPNYYAYYEDLAARIKEMGISRLAKELKLEKLPPAGQIYRSGSGT